MSIHLNTYRNIHNTFKLEKTNIRKPVNKQSMLYLYNGILCSNTKTKQQQQQEKTTTDVGNNTDES